MSNKNYNIYIIHSPSDAENYIDRTLATERQLTEEGHIVMNPLPDQANLISNEDMHFMYAHKIFDCDAAYAMDEWSKTTIGNAEMAEMMLRRKTIYFEQQV